jgi:Fibronectin type III domain
MLNLGRRAGTAFAVAAVVAIAPLSIAVTASAAAAAGDGSNDKPAAIATLKITSPNVEVKKKKADDFKPAKDGAELKEGDTVRTDATGLAEIDYGPDAYTRLDVNTTFTIKKLTEDQGSRQVEGSLDTGQTWNRTAALTESGSFGQDGAGANATVRGTVFMVTCDTPSHCVFIAIEHTTALTGTDGVTKDLTPHVACDSTKGDLCDATRTLTVDELAANDWIQSNLVQDLTERGLGTGPFVAVEGVVVVHDGVVESFTPNAPAPTAPGAPTNVSAAPGDGNATVSFTPPASDGGSPITSYTVAAAPSGLGVSALSGSPGSATGTSSPIVVEGLTNGASYSFSVTATNAVGSGPSSSPSSVVTPATTPDAPSSVTAIAGNELASVVVGAPASDGGSPVTSYTIVASPGGAMCITSFTGCTVSGLVNGTTYSFTARATNAKGTGPASASSSTVTPSSVVIPYGATYQALINPASAPTGWEQPGFDDSSWTASAAPFADNALPNSCPSFPPGASPFPVNSSIFVRKTFLLPVGATGLHLVGTVDNDGTVYINGHLVGSVTSGSCAANAIDFDFSSYLNLGGENVLAVLAADHGSDTFLDLSLSYDAPSTTALSTPPDEETTTTTTSPPDELSTDPTPPAG